MALGKSGLGFLISENKDSHGDIIKVLQDGNDEGERENLQLGWADSSQKCKEERTVDWAQGYSPDSWHLQRSQGAFVPIGLL